MSSRILVVFTLLVLASPAFGQSLGIDRGFHDLRNRERARQRNVLPAELKGALPQAQSWDATIAKLGNNPDGWTVGCFMVAIQ